MSLLIMPNGRVRPRREALQLTEEPHFDPRHVRRVVAAFEREANRAPSMVLSVRSDLPGFKVSDARRALAGVPSPGDYGGVIKPPRYPTPPPLSGPCELDLGRIILPVAEPFRPF